MSCVFSDFRFDTDEYDRAKLDLQRLCNTGEYSDTDEDRAIFSLYLKVKTFTTFQPFPTCRSDVC